MIYINITLNDGTKINYNSFDEIVNYDKIIELYCSNNGLTVLSNIVSLMTNLKSLICSNNKLTELPDFICHLTNLKYIYCYYNKLTELPNNGGRGLIIES